MSDAPTAASTRVIGNDDGSTAAGRPDVMAWGQLLQAARITVAEQDMDLRYVAVIEQPGGPDFSGIIGLRDVDIYGDALAVRLEAIKRRAIETGRPRQGRVDLPPGAGRRSYELTATPRRNQRGEIVGVLSIAVDVTPVLQAPDRLQVQHLQSQKLEGIGRLAGVVAHDFNNVLTVILGYCELLRVRQRGGTELDEITNAANRASQLTRQLLAFSRRQVLQVETVDLNDVIRGVDGMLRRVIGEKVELMTTLADDVLWVVADVGQMEQVLLNLVANAREAMPSGGTLTIATRSLGRDDPGSEDAVRGTVELTVQDSGVGMSAEVRARIFEPFFTTRGEAGAGLGLATAYGIVTQIGGQIECASAPGKGARFRVSLPLAVPPVPPSPATPLPTG